MSKYPCGTLKKIIEVNDYLKMLLRGYVLYVDENTNTQYNRGRADVLKIAIRELEAALWGDDDE